MTLTVTYDNGTTEDITSGFACSPSTLDTAGNAVAITVEYGGQQTSFTVKVVSKAIERIAVSGTYKTTYAIGETADWAGMIVTATYNDHSTKELNASEYSVTGFNSGAADDSQTITVTETVTTAEAHRKPPHLRL